MASWLSNESMENAEEEAHYRRLKRPAVSDDDEEMHLAPKRRLKKPKLLANDEDDCNNGELVETTTALQDPVTTSSSTSSTHATDTQEFEGKISLSTLRRDVQRNCMQDEGESDYLRFRAVTTEIKEKIALTLGGEDMCHVNIIRDQVALGRCSFIKTYNPPKEILQENPNLKPYQVAAIHWLLTLFGNRLNGLVADDMGLGKSAECICFLKRLYIDGLLELPTVIACPTTLLDNWANEFSKWAPCLRVLKYHGKQSDRKCLMRKFETGVDEEDEEASLDSEEAALDKGVKKASANENQTESSNAPTVLPVSPKAGAAYHVLITTHGILANHFDCQLFFKGHDFGYMVVDEAHTLKNSASQRYRQMNRSINAPNRLLLTGSPVQNQISELRNLLTFLNPYRHASFDLDRALQYHSKVWKKAIQQGKRVTKKSSGESTPSEPASNSGKKGMGELKSTANELSEAIGTNEDMEDQSISSKSKAVSSTFKEEKIAPREGPVTEPSIVPAVPEENLSEFETSNQCPSSLNVKEMQSSSKSASEPESPPDVTIASDESKIAGTIVAGDLTEDQSCGVTADPEVLFYQQLLAPLILRRLKAEVIDNFPRKTNKIEFCEMVPIQRELYDAEMLSARPLLDQVTISCKRRRAARSSKKDTISDTCDLESPSSISKQTPQKFIKGLLFRLRRICNHPLLYQRYFNASQRAEFAALLKKHVTDYRSFPVEQIMQRMEDWSDFDIHVSAKDIAAESFQIPPQEFLYSCKILRMLELVDDLVLKKQRVLIFSQFATFLDVMQEVFFLHRPTLAILRLDGQTAVDDRSTMVSAFQEKDSEYSVFLLSTKAGGVGLNLTRASTVLLMDQDWNPHNDRQAEDRVHRLGQTEDVTVYRLCCRQSFEETILSCCKKKLELDEAFGGHNESLPLEIFENIITSVQSYESLAHEAPVESLPSSDPKHISEKDPSTNVDDGANNAQTSTKVKTRKKLESVPAREKKVDTKNGQQHTLRLTKVRDTEVTSTRPSRNRKQAAVVSTKGKVKAKVHMSLAENKAARRLVLLPGGDSASDSS